MSKNPEGKLEIPLIGYLIFIMARHRTTHILKTNKIQFFLFATVL